MIKKILILIILLVLPLKVFAGYEGFLKADTGITVYLGSFVDKTDGVTMEGGASGGAASGITTLSGFDTCIIRKYGATSGVSIISNNVNVVSGETGYLYLGLKAGDLDTEGPLKIIMVDESVFLPLEWTYVVVNANVYDSLFAAASTDYLQVDTIQFEAADASDELAVITNKQTDIESGVTAIQADVNSGVSTQVNQSTVVLTIESGVSSLEAYIDNEILTILSGITNIESGVTGLYSGVTIYASLSGVTIQDGTGVGQLDTDSGTVLLRAATESQIDVIESGITIIISGVTAIQYDVNSGVSTQVNQSTILLTVESGVSSLEGYVDTEISSLLAGVTLYASLTGVTIQDGTGVGQLDTDSGTVLLRSATETQIDNIDSAVDSGVSTQVNNSTVLLATQSGVSSLELYVDTEISSLLSGVTLYASLSGVTIQDGTGTGQLDTDSGTVLLRAATETQIDNIEADTNELQTDDYPTRFDTVDNKLTDVESGMTEVQGKLPTNYIMGSSDQTDKDDNIDNIETDTNELQTDDYPARFDTVDSKLADIETGVTLIQSDVNSGVSTQVSVEIGPLESGVTLILTGVTAVETDTQDIQSRLPAALVGGYIPADMYAVSGITYAATYMSLTAKTMAVGTAAAGTLSTTQMTTDLDETTNDHWNGRLIVWTSGVLYGQVTDITDYDGASKMLTYTAITEAPTAGDTFIIF